MNAIKCAKWFLANNGSLRNGYNESNTRLQKLLYFSSLMHAAVHNKPLFDEPFEKWQNGPVVREVYKAYRYEGLDRYFGLVEGVDKQSAEVLNIINLVYGDDSAKELSEISHQHSIWKDVRINSNIDLTKMADSERTLMNDLYELYRGVDFDNLCKEVVNGNTYYYFSNNLEMTDDVINQLSEITSSQPSTFIEMVGGEIVFL